jgi:surface antigen
MIKKRLFFITSITMVLLSTSTFAAHWDFLQYDPLRFLTESDWKLSNETFVKAFNDNPDGVTSTWHNPETGASGTVTPLSSYQNDKDEQCRKVVTEDRVKSFENEYTFDACRSADGNWRIGK